MAFTEKNLGHGLVTDAVTTLYTVPSLTKAEIRDISITNIGAVSATVSIWLDPDGTAATDAEALFKNCTIFPNTPPLHWFGWEVMTAASTIKIQASANNAIRLTVAGAEVT